MRILAFDTTAGACSAAILGPDGAIIAHRAVALARGHAERLMPMLREVLEDAGVAVGALDLIAVTTGPGTFTGIRIGLAAARGLALASGVPLLGVSSFAAVAAAVAPEERAARRLVVAVESRRPDLFVQAFDAAGGVSPPAAVPPEGLARWIGPGDLLLAGDGAARAAAILEAAGRAKASLCHAGPPDAADVARVARVTWRPGAAAPPAVPHYLRAPDVTLPRPGGGGTR